MKKLNCWDFKKCGREAGTANGPGLCPVVIEQRLHTIHGGDRAGRACWMVAGTMCGGEKQGTFAMKYDNCSKCDFYQLVKREEGGNFHLSAVLNSRLRATSAS